MNRADVRSLQPEQVPDATEVLCDAFRAYPVIRFVLGADTRDYERRLAVLVRYFVMARVLRNAFNPSPHTAVGIVWSPADLTSHHRP